jgi:glycosyltransferase involved in cell wall biosynthesis
LSAGGFIQNLVYNKGADAVVAVSQGVAYSLQQLGIKAGKISIIRNGTPLEKYASMDQALSESWRKKLDLAKDTFIIGCVARRKNQEDLLKALAFLAFPTEVIFAGIAREDVDQEVLQLVNEKQHRLHFLGELASRDLLHLYPLMHVSVLPSLMEGLSQSLLEAMALGIPVVATHASGNPDLIRHGENGWLYPKDDIQGLADILRTIHTRPEAWMGMIEQARHTALQEFSLEKTLDGYEELFFRLTLPPANN